MAELGVEFGGDIDFFTAFIRVSAGSPSGGKTQVFGKGVSALDHEAFDASMESSSVIESLFDKHFVVLDMLGRKLGIEHDDDFAFASFEDGHFFTVGGFVGEGFVGFGC